MVRLLAQATDRDELFERVDVPSMYRHWGVELEPEGDHYRAYCPFHLDRGRPNLTVGPADAFYCHSCGVGGSHIDFIAFMHRPADEHDLHAASPPPERVEVGIAFKWLKTFIEEQPLPLAEVRARREREPQPDPDPIDPAVVQEWVDELWNTPAGRGMVDFLVGERGISIETLGFANVGYDPQSRRITIPVYDAGGNIRNVRKYRRHAPKGVAKVWSYAKGYGRNRRMHPRLEGGSPVLLLAGEMDWLKAQSMGYVNADTFTSGESYVPKREEVENWIGRDLYICYDNDDAGQKGARKLASRLYEFGVRPSIVQWPEGTPENGYDFTDFTNDDHTKEDCDTLISSAVLYEPTSSDRSTTTLTTASPKPAKAKREPKPVSPPSMSDGNRTDIGNAERLVGLHGEDLHWCARWKTWIAWDDQHWLKDETGEAMRRAMDTARRLLLEAFAVDDDDKRKKWVKHALDSHSDGSLNAMLRVARAFPGVAITPEVFDTDPWLLNLQNGTLDLRILELRPHSRADLLTKMLPYAYDPGARADLWVKFLERVFPDAQLRAYVQRAVGYCLTGVIREHVFFVLWGKGRNGKSTFIETLYKLLGEYGANAASETFMAQRPGTIREDLARLAGVRFVGASETNEGKELDIGVVKMMSGDDTITSRRLYENSFDYDPQFKPWLRTNHKPIIKLTDDPIWDRVKLIPFVVRIPDEEQDPALQDRLAQELPGILNWAVEGCRQWLKDGLGEPEAVTEATEAYRNEMDVLAPFLADHCETGEGVSVLSQTLYRAYESQCSQANEKPMTQTKFNARLEGHGYRRGFNSAGQRVWRGLTLRNGKSTHQALTHPTPTEGDDANG